MKKQAEIQTGNAIADATKGWFVGAVIDESFGMRHRDDIELKWSTHKAGEERAEWVTGEVRTAIAILISGEFQVMFRDQTVTLSKPGDFVMWGEGSDHKYVSPKDSVLLTVRWPSIPRSPEVV